MKGPRAGDIEAAEKRPAEETADDGYTDSLPGVLQPAGDGRW